MKFDHTYLIVKDIARSVEIYAALLGRTPDCVENDQWVDWNKEGAYFGLMSFDEWRKTGGKDQHDADKLGAGPVIVFRSSDLQKDAMLVENLGLEIKTPPQKVAGLGYDYSYFEFTDPDGYEIEVAQYAR